jgi:hypothetical protein
VVRLETTWVLVTTTELVAVVVLLEKGTLVHKRFSKQRNRKRKRKSLAHIHLHREIALSIVARLSAATTRVAAADTAGRTAPLVVAVAETRAAGTTGRAVAAAVAKAKIGAVREAVPLHALGLLRPAEADLWRMAIEGRPGCEAVEEAV